MNLRVTTLVSLLKFNSPCEPKLHQLLQWRGLVKVRLKWVKNRGLDHIIDKETDLKAVCLLKDAIKRSSTGFVTAKSVADWQKHLGLTIPVLRFMRRYPTLFEEFPHARYASLPCFPLTDTARLLDSQEQNIHQTNEANTVERLSRVLMMLKSPKKSRSKVTDEACISGVVEFLVFQFFEIFLYKRCEEKMRRFRMVEAWFRLSRATHFVQATRPLSTNTNNGKAIADKSIRDYDAYKQLDKLDFMTAAKILFTHPPKQKKFGIDFHLVQLFFVCMPSLAVYLVAQYARYEIRRMEAEVEVKKKKAEEEEEKAKVMEANSLKEKEEAESDPELFNVKVRLEALEEVVKEIALEAKKLSSSSLTKHGEGNNKNDKLETLSSTSENKSKNKN